MPVGIVKKSVPVVSSNLAIEAIAIAIVILMKPCLLGIDDFNSTGICDNHCHNAKIVLMMVGGEENGIHNWRK